MTSDNKRRISGALGGLVNGLFGGGGGMVLVPLLTRWCGIEEKKAFATCVAVIFPFCVLSVAIYWLRGGVDLAAALPYLLGGLAGGWVGGRLMGRVSVVWLRRIFAAFLLYGGVRYLL
ncbi:MAG: sulfite exporter TauE/SafE family protein [Ruminococcaceae bacterium]|nr:sulfite exporter TauE/SafE family protein [Oscillospiraceae bacterium]